MEHEFVVPVVEVNLTSCVPQEAVPTGDADDGSTFEAENTPSKGDPGTELSWSSTPVRVSLLTPGRHFIQREDLTTALLSC